MNFKTQNLLFMNKQFIVYLKSLIIFSFIVSLLFIACSKKSINNLQTEEALSAKFFSQIAINDNDIQNIAKQIKQKNDNEHFLLSFIQNKGYILWNDAEKVKSSKGLLAILPFAFENGKEINGFVIARQDFQLNTISFDVFTKNNLSLYGFTENGNKLNAQKVQSIVNYFNYKKFNINTYQLQDIRQLPDSIRNNYPNFIDKNKLFVKFKIRTSKTSSSSSNIADMSMLAGQDCFGYWEEQEIWWNPDGDPCNCSGDEYYVYSIDEYIITVCYGFGGGGYGGGGFGDSGTPPTGGGGGGGSNVDIIIPPDAPEYHDISEFEPPVSLQSLFNCFAQIPDAGATYTVKLCVDLPVNGFWQAPFNLGASPGHTFLTLTKTNGSQTISQSVGFYPIGSGGNPVNPNATGRFKNNGNPPHQYNAAITDYNVSANQFSMVMNNLLSHENDTYNLNNNNCTTIALNTFNLLLTTPITIEPFIIQPPGIPPPLPLIFMQSPQKLYKKIGELYVGAGSGLSKEFDVNYDSPLSRNLCP